MQANKISAGHGQCLIVNKSEDRSCAAKFWIATGSARQNLSMQHCVFNSYPTKRVQNGSGSHPASYSMGTGGSFPWGKAAGA